MKGPGSIRATLGEEEYLIFKVRNVLFFWGGLGETDDVPMKQLSSTSVG